MTTLFQHEEESDKKGRRRFREGVLMKVAEAEGLGLPGSVCVRGGRSHAQVISAEGAA